jgi:arylsulfatase A-like enzyme
VSPGRRPALRALLVGFALAIGCEREARVPVELDLAAFGLTLGDWTPRSIVVEAVGPRRRIVQAPGDAFELFVRLPFDPRLRFTLDPRTPDDAFAVSVGAGSTMTALRPRRVGEGDWESTVDGSEPGGIVRLRFENRGASPLAWWEPRLTGTARPLAPAIGTAVRPPPGPLNVILLVSDALRADHLGLYGYRRPTTPELERLAAQHGVVFEHAYAAGPSTPNSIPSLFTSRHPSSVGVSFPAAPRRTDRTLAEAFSLAGARTAAFVGNPLLMAELGYGRGFGAYEILRVPEPSFPHAAALVDRTLEYLSANRDAPCFVYVHLMDTHTPFDPPAPHRGRFEGEGPPRPSSPRRPPPVQGFRPEAFGRPGPWLPVVPDEQTADPDRYDEAIAYVDEQVGRLVRGLDALGMGDRTALVVTADHGEALGTEDDGRYLHGQSLFEELARVPLVFHLPWLAVGQRISDVVSLVDVAPTILDLAGVPVPASFGGASLFRPGVSTEPPAALFERIDAQSMAQLVLNPGSRGVVEWGVREGRWKLLLEDYRVRLYDLVDDPKETADASMTHRDIAGYLTGRIARSSPAFRQRDRATAVVPAELERPLGEALKALGYLAE